MITTDPTLCRKRASKKKPAKVGRKKAKTSGGDEALTPRTRAALAREASAKAKREALEAQMKAEAARELAEAAAREEMEATRNEFEAAREEEGGLELMALEAVLPETPIRRYSFHLL